MALRSNVSSVPQPSRPWNLLHGRSVNRYVTMPLCCKIISATFASLAPSRLFAIGRCCG